jgi:hypothetical protein
MRCNCCGSDNSGRQAFLRRLRRETASSVPKRGAENPEGKKFCGDCGSPIGHPRLELEVHPGWARRSGLLLLWNVATVASKRSLGIGSNLRTRPIEDRGTFEVGGSSTASSEQEGGACSRWPSPSASDRSSRSDTNTYLDESGSCPSHGPVSPSLPKTHFFAELKRGCGSAGASRASSSARPPAPSEFLLAVRPIFSGESRLPPIVASAAT